ncbi:MAG: glycoside hydrolase family 3 C-terminal domain-containing protein [Acidobacteria bacterium]|nr:glycoside hydrolase family 3 C-terminal domain-containing protein [Acidobacteriota bacterium]
MKLSTINLFLAFILIFNSLAVAAPPAAGPARKRFEPSEKSWKAADKTLKKMSVDEKVGQLIQVGINARFVNQDSEFFQDLKRQVADNKIGGIILFGAPIYETVHLVNRMQENAKIPLLIALDAETGVGMRFQDAANFPWNMAVAATGNPDYAYKMGVVTGREAKAMGIMQVYAPVLDVNNNPDNPVINVRSYSEDPDTVARFGTAFMEGVQSEGVIATAKHFPGHGDTNVDSHRGLPIIDVSRERLDKLELVPFKSAIDAGIASVMVAHIGLPQIDPTEVKPIKNALRVETDEEVATENATIPATLSPKIQTEILRKQLGFKGLIVTDAMSMSGLTQYVTQEEAGVEAFLAGSDLLEKPADADAMIKGLREAVKSGRIPEARLDESVRKILAWKYELGLFKQKITPLDQIDRIVSTKETHALSEEIANRAVTLVKNDDKLLPLDKTKRVFVLGISNGFDGELTSYALTKFMRDNSIRFGATLLQDNSTPEQFARAREAANRADVVIVAMYGRVRSGQKNSVGIPEAGAEILRDLIAKNKKVIGVSFGNPYILTSFPSLKTYVVGYGDMPSLQRAAVRSLYGMIDVTGRLPISLPGLYPRGTGIQMKAAN